MPEGMHSFVAGYLRYVTHVQAFISLAANPFPKFYMGDTLPPYPVDLEVAPRAHQNRAVTFFRLFLAIPALLISSALGGVTGGFGSFDSFRGHHDTWQTFAYRGGGAVAGTAALLIWFAAMARGRAPRGLRDLAAWAVGYGAQLTGYLLLLTDRYPTSDPLAHLAREPEAAAAPPDETVDPAVRLAALHELRANEPGLSLDEAMARLDAQAPAEPAAAEGEAAEPGPAPLTLPPMPGIGVVTGDLRRSRLTVLFRFALWLPHLVWYLLWAILAAFVIVLNWFAALVLGRAPRPFARFLSAFVRYQLHMVAFISLIGNPFPGFVGKAGSYPIDVELDPFQRQRRVTIFFRGFLAFPALLLQGAGFGVVAVAALLGWFYALVRGRMPVGLRNAGAWALTYTAQTDAYLYLLSDRYPFSSPLAVSWRE